MGKLPSTFGVFSCRKAAVYIDCARRAAPRAAAAAAGAEQRFTSHIVWISASVPTHRHRLLTDSSCNRLSDFDIDATRVHRQNAARDTQLFQISRMDSFPRRLRL